jgi:anthranilate synthase component 1
MSIQLHCVHKLRPADTETPVTLYLKLRDCFPQTLLMEHATQFHTEGRKSYICCEPIAGIRLQENTVTQTFPDGTKTKLGLGSDTNIVDLLDDFLALFTIDDPISETCGLFGYAAFDAVQYTEQISFTNASEAGTALPELVFDVYRYVLVFDHVRNDLTIAYHYTGEAVENGIAIIERLLERRKHQPYPFRLTAEEKSNVTDNEFIDMVTAGKQHCYRGDVFQVVLSRAFEVSYQGDDFNVYRALRCINPSPYLFYFDYGDFRLFGSSPEAQIKKQVQSAILYPIAGTYPRTGEPERDKASAIALQDDEKEHAEHVMLIDLARNDLSKNYAKVSVPVFKNIEQFSHVLHIVSEVRAELPLTTAKPFRVWSDTFPAGTLSGAPKHKALTLINKYENRRRGFYGGSIGFVGFNGCVNQAIMIRSFLSKQNKLHYRAGAGIVAASVPANELAEVNNKIAALRKAIQLASTRIQ